MRRSSSVALVRHAFGVSEEVRVPGEDVTPAPEERGAVAMGVIRFSRAFSEGGAECAWNKTPGYFISRSTTVNQKDMAGL